MKKHLFFCAFLFCTAFFCHAAEYFAGEGVTDLKVAQDGNNGEYVFYIQEGRIKAVHLNAEGSAAVFTIFTDSDTKPEKVTGLQVNEIPQNIVTFMGEEEGTVYLYSEFINDADGQNCITKAEIGKRGDSFSAVKTIRSFSDNSIRYFFLQNGQLFCSTLSLANGAIAGNLRLTGTGVYVTEYSVISADNKLIGYYVSDAGYPELTLFVLDGTSCSTVYSDRIDKECRINLQSSILSDVYCILQDDTTSSVLKYADGVFQKIHTEEGNVQYPLVWLGNEDFSKKIKITEDAENNTYIVNDSYQTEQKYTYVTAVPVSTKKAYMIYKNETWQMAVTDFAATTIRKIDIPPAAEYVSTLYDNGCVLVFIDRKNNQVIFASIGTTDNCSYKTVSLSAEKQILSDIGNISYAGGLIIISDGISHVLINPLSKRTQFFSSELFAVSMRINDRMKVCTYANGYITAEENDNE